MGARTVGIELRRYLLGEVDFVETRVLSQVAFHQRVQFSLGDRAGVRKGFPSASGNEGIDGIRVGEKP